MFWYFYQERSFRNDHVIIAISKIFNNKINRLISIAWNKSYKSINRIRDQIEIKCAGTTLFNQFHRQTGVRGRMPKNKLQFIFSQCLESRDPIILFSLTISQSMENSIVSVFIKPIPTIVCKWVNYYQQFEKRIRVKWRLPRLHCVSSNSGASEFLFIVEEGIAVETDVSVVDSVSPECVAHPFAGHGGSHQRHDIAHPSRQLEHYHHQGNCAGIQIQINIDWLRLIVWSRKYALS